MEKARQQFLHELRADWVKVCNNYLKTFAARHDISTSRCYWVGDRIGTIADFEDWTVSMEDMRYDVDNQVDPNMYFSWYDKSVEYTSMGLSFPSYENYCKGCPDPYTPEQLEHIRESQKRVQTAKDELEKCILEAGGNPSKNLTLM